MFVVNTLLFTFIHLYSRNKQTLNVYMLGKHLLYPAYKVCNGSKHVFYLPIIGATTLFWASILQSRSDSLATASRGQTPSWRYIYVLIHRRWKWDCKPLSVKQSTYTHSYTQTYPQLRWNTGLIHRAYSTFSAKHGLCYLSISDTTYLHTTY